MEMSDPRCDYCGGMCDGQCPGARAQRREEDQARRNAEAAEAIAGPVVHLNRKQRRRLAAKNRRKK